jgi:hypothetical protein
MLEHPLYLLDLTPCDFFMFSELKISLKWSYSELLEDVQSNEMTILEGPSKSSFWQYFQA